jgi:hypothetical protein
VKGVGKSPRNRPHERQEAAETEQRLRLLAIILRMVIEIVQPFLDHWSGGGPGRLLLRLAARAQKRHPRSSLTRANERGDVPPQSTHACAPAITSPLTGKIRALGNFQGTLVHLIFPIAGIFPIDGWDSANVGGRLQTSVMESELPPTLRYLARRQSGLVSRSQARQAGLSEDMIKFRVRSGRWRRIHPGVYATFTGELNRRAYLWAAVLSAGPGAALSHDAAAELHRLSDRHADPVHVTVPRGSPTGHQDPPIPAF